MDRVTVLERAVRVLISPRPPRVPATTAGWSEIALIWGGADPQDRQALDELEVGAK